MQNWNERTQRSIEEQKAAEAAKYADIARRDQEVFQRVNELWLALDVGSTLRRINNELWGNKGVVRVSNESTRLGRGLEPHFPQRWVARCEASLGFQYQTPVEKKEPIYTTKYGWYEESVRPTGYGTPATEGLEPSPHPKKRVFGRVPELTGYQKFYVVENRSTSVGIALEGDNTLLIARVFGHDFDERARQPVLRIRGDKLDGVDLTRLRDLIDQALLSDCVHRQKFGYFPDDLLRKTQEMIRELSSKGYQRR